MFSQSLIPRTFGVLCLALLSLHAEAPATGNEVRFADSGKPGQLKIIVTSGKIHISPGKEPGLVRVVSSTKTETAAPREDGLRVLGDTQAAYSLKAKDNAAELIYDKEAWGGDARFEVTVPSDTSVQIQSSWGGDIAVEGLSGDLSVQGMNCDVSLEGVSGGTNIELMNGKVHASYTTIRADKAISISSMNGPVVLKVPENSKANVRFRTHNGAILTDFNETQLKTKSEDLGGTHWGAMAGKHAAIAVNIAREIGKEIADQAKDAAEQVRTAVEIHEQEIVVHEKEMAEHNQQLSEQDAEDAKADAAAARQAKAEAPEEPQAPKAPNAPRIVRAPRAPRTPIVVNIPAISGGKVVSGTLNEGGTTIQVTLMNGDVTFRKLVSDPRKQIGRASCRERVCVPV